jgi:hypothetical protein
MIVASITRDVTLEFLIRTEDRLFRAMPNSGGEHECEKATMKRRAFWIIPIAIDRNVKVRAITRNERDNVSLYITSDYLLTRNTDGNSHFYYS